ncbi:hypothetical protein D7D25_17555 [Proteiniphilum sp. X52]|nr:hypothetical protein D7D25_17555 [Proteiniphilum sp. X52]
MPILVGMAWGALIGAATSAVIYTVQVGITSGFKDFNLSNLGMAALMGGVGGAIGGGLGALGSQIGTFGQSLGYNILSNVTSNSATTMAFGGDVSWGNLAGMVAGGVLGAKIGNFSGVKGGALKNIGAEMAFGIGKGAATGGVGGAVGAAIDGKNIGKGLLQGAKNGAIAGGTLAGLNVVSMGATYKPDISYGEFDDYTPVYRRGHFLWPKSAGMTVGRNLVTRLTGDDPDYDSYLQAHETGHLDQQAKMGFANFYGEILKEYLTEGFYASYDIPNTLEHGANLYSLNRIGYFWSNKYGRITKQNYDYYY